MEPLLSETAPPPEHPSSRRAGEEFEVRKLEAVGTLAAGIAHEYNNLLMAITGFAELLHRRVAPDSTEQRYVAEIRAAADRAASLTHQLLAVGRKQMLTPRVLNLNDLLLSLAPALQRRFGSGIRVETQLAADLLPVEADAAALRSVITEMALNARDAMPAGGTLTLATSREETPAEMTDGDEAAARGAVALRIRDTGSGMAEKVQARLFEPFFTTKDSGAGTGLGLATAHGFVRQSGGHIAVESAPGEGTTFTIYLPPAITAPEPEEVEGNGREGPAAVVLVAEDDEMVRGMIREVLEDAGYTVLGAPHALGALETGERNAAPVDLLLTDVVMPGMNGPELAERLAPSNPNMKVLYMSGYPGDELARFGIPESAACLQKPFSPQALVRRVKRMLDGR